MRRLGVLAGFVVLLSASASRANPPDTFGFGSRETAMGGAVAAETRGVSANYYNPAALARSRGLVVQLGYTRAEHRLRMNGEDSAVSPVKGMHMGLVAPGTLVRMPVAFGLAAYIPDGSLARVRTMSQEIPRWELYDTRNQRLFLAVNVAAELAPWLWIGGGMSFMSSTRGAMAVTGSANVLRPDDSSLRHEVDADLAAVRYPQAGVRVKVSDRVALAAVYRGQFRLALDLGARLYGDVSGLTTALYELETRSVANFLPQQVAVGGAWSLSPRLRTTFDATWINWSAYETPAAKVDVKLDVPPPPSGWPSTLTPPTAPAPTRIVPLVLHDRVVPRVGLEWLALSRPSFQGFVRSGYEFAKSPIAAQTGLTSYVDRDRHALSLGFGAALPQFVSELPGTLSIDAHVQLAILPTEATRKASAADYVGDFTAGGHILNVGLTAGFAFDGNRKDHAP